MPCFCNCAISRRGRVRRQDGKSVCSTRRSCRGQTISRQNRAILQAVSECRFIQPWPDTGAPQNLIQIMISVQDDITQRLGVLPNLFQSVPADPEAVRRLWAFACVAYLDNPLPERFRERLCVWLSRFCEVRYCVARHVGFLVSLESAANEPGSRGIDSVLPLLDTSLPRGATLREHIGRCAACREPFGTLLPEDPALELSIFACATHVFFQTEEAAGCLTALSRALGHARTQQVLLLQSFLHHEHDLTRMHPELLLDDDVEQLLATYPELGRRLFEDPEVRLVQSIGFRPEAENLSCNASREGITETATRLQQELDDSRLLHEISNELIREQQIDALYGKIVDAATRLMRSQFATMQMVDMSEAG